MSINLHRLAADIEFHTGTRPPLVDVADAATHLATRGVHHLIDLRGERVVLAREHYEAAPDDARELDVRRVRARRLAPDVASAMFMIAACWFAVGVFFTWHAWLSGAYFAALGVVALVWLAGLIRTEEK